MIIIFYDNFASFKKSKLTYKLILSKQKAGFGIESCFLVSAEIYSQWFIDVESHILRSWVRKGIGSSLSSLVRTVLQTAYG